MPDRIENSEGLGGPPLVREGKFDAQMSFGLPQVEAPAPITTIVKRDGRRVPFEKRKIADAIFKAAQSIGGEDRDRADSLASAVTIFLAKHLKGDTPTVDQVHDAVERVLIEMGHARTALTYARYRDKRDRLRRLRSGDIRAILAELDEARHEGEALQAAVQRPLFVRTSDERLAGWDRERIVTALVRETKMAEGMARMIAIEVESQISRAGLTTLTTPLIRELVDAKLVEHGLTEYRARHMRLGVPLYDAERIICMPNQDETEGTQDPAATNLALAEHVKREFALSQVYSQAIADAHLSGDVHLHDLPQIDRLHSGGIALDLLKQFGLAMYSGKRFAPPPIQAEMLLAQVTRFGSAIRAHFAHGVRWPAFNTLLAPCLVDHEQDDLRRLAYFLVFALNNAGIQRGPAPSTEIELAWTTPYDLLHREAIGPGGAVMDDEYHAYAEPAQAFAMAFIAAAKDAINAENGGFTTCLTVSESFFAAPGHEEFLSEALESTHLRRHLRIAFERGPTGRDETVAPWQMRNVLANAVSLNLPRYAARSRSEERFCAALDPLLDVAIQAHREKRHFLARLFDYRDIGPMAPLAFQHGGATLVDIAQADFAVCVTGLNETVQILTGDPLHASENAAACAGRLVEYLGSALREKAGEAGISAVLMPGDDPAVARRFALLDLQRCPDEIRAVLKSDPITRDLTYTPGARAWARLSAMERLRVDGRHHAHFTGPAHIALSLDGLDPSTRSLLDCIEKAFHQTAVHSLSFEDPTYP